jgi:hypothetical protein
MAWLLDLINAIPRDLILASRQPVPADRDRPADVAPLAARRAHRRRHGAGGAGLPVLHRGRILSSSRRWKR